MLYNQYIKTKDDSELIYSASDVTEQIPTLNFIKFETKYIETAIDYIKTNLINKVDTIFVCFN